MVKIMTMRRLKNEIAWFVAFSITIVNSAIVPPPWADPASNPCASQPRGWQLLYWPADGKCYKIFQIGAPCPETMELSPSAVGSETRAECRCPPGTAQSPRDALCHPIFTRASCPIGQYFAPVPESTGKASSKKRWGVCRDPEPCDSDKVFWPRDGKCYGKYTRGPCPKGELLVLDKDGLAKCSCSRDGELGKYYSLAGGCHEFYTRGPCQEPGELFLPSRQCGCYDSLPNYHPATKMCYPLGGIGPCAVGQYFIQPDSTSKNTTSSNLAICTCKPNYVPYKDGHCYRAHTQGPCPVGEMLINSTTCLRIPCKRGRLYFPRERTCYKIGTRGPCSNGQVVLYDYSARPSIDGISYNGVCGCTSSTKCMESLTTDDKCEDIPGMVLMNHKCYKLYTKGPCNDGEWLVARRLPRNDDNDDDKRSWKDDKPALPRARCECRPGYTRISDVESNSLSIPQKCQAPAVGIAKFLNDNIRSRGF